MASEYNWHPGIPSKSVFKVETRNLGWWVLLAILISVIVHVVLYIVLGAIERHAKSPAEDGIIWRSHHDQVTIDRDKLNELLADPADLPEPTETKPEKLSDLELTDKSLDEFDLMEKLKDEPIRMAPVDAPQIFSTEAPKAPAQALEMASNQLEISAAEMLSQDLADMRNKLVESSAQVSVSQPVLELNADDKVGGDVDTDEFFKEAAAKAFGNGAEEFIKGYSSLDALIGRTGGLPSGEEKIALPTDILFEYNEYQLKEEARLSMMKLAFVVQTNPDATFIIEGHTDSFGGDQFNLDLSLKRAEAVRDWLVERLRIDASNIRVIGLGKTRPIVAVTGTAEEQSLNRRVEIVVRKG